MSTGDVVWAGLGAIWVVWGITSGLARALPGPAAVLRGIVWSRTGRLLALAAWGAAGWHLFCQRP